MKALPTNLIAEFDFHGCGIWDLIGFPGTVVQQFSFKCNRTGELTSVLLNASLSSCAGDTELEYFTIIGRYFNPLCNLAEQIRVSSILN